MDRRILRKELMKMNRTFALGDLHGNYDLWKAILSKLDPTDKVICLGDVVDRGPKGYDILLEILADKRFTLLKGNHEDMFAKSIQEYNVTGFGDYNHYCNGGSSTLDAWIFNGANSGILRIINRLPLKYLYVNKNKDYIWLSHAGFNPDNIPKDNRIFLWNREHFYGWMDIEKHPNDYIIHGHTPIGHMKGKDDERPELGPYWYNDGHKCNIDFLAWKNNYIFLLDLDTFEAVEVRI